jgi:hypothetical protein
VNVTIADETGSENATFFEEAMSELLGQTCKDVIVKHGYTDPTVAPPEIHALRGVPAVLRVTTKREAPLSVNRATKRDVLPPQTPDAKTRLQRKRLHESPGKRIVAGLLS